MTTNYDIHTDIKYPPLTLIDVARDAAQAPSEWWNQTLCQVNESVVRLGVFESGAFHWHQHEREDELFYVVEGELIIDVEPDRTVRLGPQQGFVVPRGIVHRTRVEQRTVVLMIETASIIPTGDAS